jgi:predicted transcriptional regulator
LVAKFLAGDYVSFVMKKTPPPETLTRREREIMDSLHRRGRATAHEVLEDLADPPSYSAVRALLRLLEERGHIKHAEEGQRYVYSPVASRGDARKSALSHVVRTFFAGSVGDAVVALVESSRAKLSQEELERLSDAISRAKKEGR